MSISNGNSTTISYTVTNPLQDPIYVNDATVTVTIQDSNGVDLPDETWPFVLPYVSGSDGIYRHTFDPFTSLVVGELYTVIINVDGADGLQSECKYRTRAVERQCC